GIILEPIVQGAGGMRFYSPGYLREVRRLCDETGLLLVADEIATGFGRTGEWFAYQHFGVVPDVMTLAKSLCGGIAGGALLTKAEIAPSLRPGMHASTFGGNPIAAAAGIATLEMIEKQQLLERARVLSDYFRSRFEELAEQCSLIGEVRILGLMIGLQVDADGAAVVQRCLEEGLLVNCTQERVIRLLPAMTLSDSEAEEGCNILSQVLSEVS
ncbi:MAG: aminotransferase class III-fold pyridoxal phosphate-dependent enzyme, partial [Pirellulales bacterium]|nr:aminotransferase class III-fold pyridoxal phosphate-dependent enzyme [Pirellulales bacterium]